MTSTRKPPTDTISFRASIEMLKLMDAKRQDLNMSRGDWAKMAAYERLDRDEINNDHELHAELVEMIQSLEAELKGLRTLLARLLHIILVYVGEVPIEESKVLVKSKFLRDEK